ncbi:MAG: hypothetical protein JWP00_1570 [Chloroflexi bacterium]|jgi:uncharacterized membrane protein|nr:hypothetical protein [Chloroflexota bacterium]
MKRKLVISILSVAALMLVFTLPAFAHEGVGGDELASADSMLLIAMLFVLMTGLGVMWSWANGELKNPEQIKNQMLLNALLDEDGDELDKYALTEA